jgi:cysteine synthase
MFYVVQVKAEYENPGGTSKDRVARQIVEDAEDAGVLGPGGTIVEGSSGSTGISLALMAACRGYACTIFMPDDQAVEKSNLLVTLGASVERVKPVSIVHPKHYVNLARKYAESTPGAFFANQFENGSNWRAHYASTGPEIWRQTQGKIDAFVMGAGTGGTLAGVSKYLKEQASRIKVVLVDPPGSSLYNRVKHGVCYAEEQAESRVRRHRPVVYCCVWRSCLTRIV